MSNQLDPDEESMTALQALAKLKDVESLKPFSLDLLRACQASLRKLSPLIDGELRSADEKELAEARARVAEIEARIGVKPTPPHPPRVPSEGVDETDAGSGLGIAAVEGATVEQFQDELRQLRAHTQAKRRHLK